MKSPDFEYFNSENFEELLKKFSEVKKTGKTIYFDIIELENLLDYFLDNYDYSEVQYLIKMSEKIHPFAAGIKIRKARLFFAKGIIDKSLEVLDNVLAVEPSNEEAYLIKGLIEVVNMKYEAAEKHFAKAIENSPDEGEDIMFTIAHSLEHAKQYLSAAKYFTKAYKLSGEKDPEILYDLAFCYEKADKIEKSNIFYNKYLDSNPFSETAWYNLGVNYFNSDNYAKALTAFEYALTIDPDYLPPLKAKADCLSSMERYKESIKFYFDYLDNKETDDEPEIYTEIGKIYKNIEETENAFLFFEKAIEINEHYSDAWYELSLLYYYQNDISESIDSIGVAIKYSPYNPDYWYYLGIYYDKNEEDDEAEKAFKKALKLYPYDTEFWLSYADMEFSVGNVNKAIELLTRSQSFIQDIAVVKYRLTAYYLEISDKNKALTYFSEAVNLNAEASGEFFTFYPKAQYIDEFNDLLRKNH